MEDLRITTLAERPELAQALDRMPDTWPEFVLEDVVGWANFPRIAAEFPEFVLVATGPDGSVAARAYSVPFELNAPGRGKLPVGGWDRVLLWAFSDLRRGRTPDTVSAIEITVATGHQGKGISGRMLAAMRENAGRHGFGEVVAPVRPSGKHLRPALPMAEYARLTRPEDGLPEDPWLRVHVRAGGVVDSVAPVSMTVSGTLEEWRSWTGLPFDTEGPVEVPGALVPVHCSPAHGYAVYTEPNVWVRHRV
ncbi:N-acetyltransferase [Streptomyces rhizosphaericola]|uniref:N-acetyltransferase n=1 Tax=Streptomyces rhizosphaericola TaxID=2564098 RepID=A0ABY2PEZ9_9ACTN|nr:N-acetyltransferase [Streptomyces rhizosphaericola]TGZ09512.1 N-acetyltransferase [Streptomyces rhizosphaericola]